MPKWRRDLRVNTPLVLDAAAVSRLAPKERHRVKLLARRANRVLKGSEIPGNVRRARMNRQEFGALRWALGKLGCLDRSESR
jgi:hypothetical protein